MALQASVPEQIGRYRIEAVLGRGAMGVIYGAHDPAIDRKVAIKLVRADLLDGDDRADYVTRFQREAQAAGRCAHPNIVAVYDFALHEQNPYIAMEYIDGVTLQHIATRPGGFSAAEIVSLGGQMLDGLGAAHALGIIHRDIKPANIMLTAGGRVKVTDFGISRLDTSVLTGAGGVIGTPSYMSPEQCRGEATDGRSDLFSTAVVLYELVTGTKPFRGASQHEVWHKLLTEDPPDSAALRPDMPQALHEAIRRALSKDPAARFPTAAAMAAALRSGQAPQDDGLAALATGDHTVVQAVSQPGLDLDVTTMTTIERGLARHVGPIAAFLVRNAIGTSETVDALYERLAANIDDPAKRDQFRKEMAAQSSGSQSRSGTDAVALPEAELARAQAELAHYVGPIARILVKRAAPGCADVAQLWHRLSENVERPLRATFLGKL